MKKTAGATNRTWLAILGVILLAAGAFWAVCAAGLLSGAGADWHPTGRPLRGASSALDLPWLAPVAIILGAAIVVSGLWWLIRQIPRGTGASTFRFHSDPRSGYTLVEPKVITAAIADHVRDLTYVTDAKVGLKGQLAEPEMIMDVTVHERADLREVTREIRSEVLPAAVRVLGRPLASVGITYSMSRNSASKREVKLQ